MNGIGQVIITLWFLPVVLFIFVPLFVGLLWVPISFLARYIQREVDHERQVQSANTEARAIA